MAADRVLKTLAAAIFFFGAATTVFAQQLDAAAPSAEPMPGFLDGDAGARKLRYRCAGEGEPAVVIEAGGATSFETLYSWERTQGFRPGWLDVIAAIEKATRVCVYDRAGLGRSDKAPIPRTSADVATDMRALLRNEKIRDSCHLRRAVVRRFQLPHFRQSLPQAGCRHGPRRYQRCGLLAARSGAPSAT